MTPRHLQPANERTTDGNAGQWRPAVATSTAADRADANLRLFRSEVMAERQTQWLGTVMLAPRASHRLFAMIGVLAMAAILALLFFMDFTRTARVNGWLLPQEGVVRVFAPRPGVVSGLHVKEGAAIRKGDRLLTLSDELQSTALGATQVEVMKQLAERRASLAEERGQQQRLLLQQNRAFADRIAALHSEEAQIEREIDLLRARVAIASRAEALHREQYQTGFISEMRLQQVQSEVLEQRARLGALERNRLTAIRERMGVEAERADLPMKAGKEIAILERSIAQLQQERAEAEARREIVVRRAAGRHGDGDPRGAGGARRYRRAADVDRAADASSRRTCTARAARSVSCARDSGCCCATRPTRTSASATTRAW